MVLAYAFCNVAVMPLRTGPAHTAEQCSQLLYGEKAEVLEVNNNEWARIRCEWDKYEGWCKQSQLALITPKEYRRPTRQVAATHMGRILSAGAEAPIPLGSELINIKALKSLAALPHVKYKGAKLAVKKQKPGCEAVKEAAMRYLHAPYQWGGRTVAGIDCSGLSQMAYKLCGLPLPRNASEQAETGALVGFLQSAQCGDLAFFDNKEGRINHVGILLDNETIIHATDTAGRVVIDHIDQGGIISKLLRRRTHNLRVVRRVM